MIKWGIVSDIQHKLFLSVAPQDTLRSCGYKNEEASCDGNAGACTCDWDLCNSYQEDMLPTKTTTSTISTTTTSPTTTSSNSTDTLKCYDNVGEDPDGDGKNCAFLENACVLSFVKGNIS